MNKIRRKVEQIKVQSLYLYVHITSLSHPCWSPRHSSTVSYFRVGRSDDRKYVCVRRLGSRVLNQKVHLTS